MVSAYIFHNMFVFDNLISYIMFFSVLAYVNTRAFGSKVSTGAFYEKTISDFKLNSIVIPATSLVVLLAVYFVNVPAIRANTTLIQAMSPQSTGGVETNLNLFKKTFSYNSFGSSEALEQLIQVTSQIATTGQVPDTIKQEFYNFTKAKIEEKVKQTPNDARYTAFAAGFFNRFAQYDEAMNYAEKSIELSPKKQSFYFELGTVYLGKGDPKKAFEIFKKAYDLEPASPESKIIYIVGAIYTKNDAVLKEILPQMNVESFISDNRILRAYADIGDINTVIAILTERLKKDPTNMQYKLSLASAYLQIGQRQTAINLIQEMIKQDPTFKEQGESYIKQIQGQ